MFRIVFRSNSLLLPAECRRNSVRLFISSENSSKPQQVNTVELIGKIHKHLFTLPSGYKMLILQTKELDNKYFYHMVGTGTTMRCEAGQRVHLIGRICSQNYWTEEKKLRQKIVIKTGELEFLPKSVDIQSDKNHVQLCSQIYSDIENTRHHSAFTMTTHHTTKGGVSAGIYVAENHRILIREPSLLDFVRNDLKRLDWIRIEGQISYTFSRNSKLQLRSSGYILANSITKENTNPS
ncbi:uncharacterized protein LOC129575334 [Sitodiplosis mosellana]|uniref:uncharacterized protein LOC129575334 n=1 Tax=Sitodiplosis mosellana TaxID=263140 RepID=UPI002443C504|nr:uncharacterized protein LOC129575334 [Sitodiplosis mosellana]